jgi:hypothetical protein
LRANPIGVRRRSVEANPQPALPRAIPKELRCRGVLRYGEVEPAVAIEIRVCGAALVAVDQNAGLLT